MIRKSIPSEAASGQLRPRLLLACWASHLSRHRQRALGSMVACGPYNLYWYPGKMPFNTFWANFCRPMKTILSWSALLIYFSAKHTTSLYVFHLFVMLRRWLTEWYICWMLFDIMLLLCMISASVIHVIVIHTSTYCWQGITYYCGNMSVKYFVQ